MNETNDTTPVLHQAALQPLHADPRKAAMLDALEHNLGIVASAALEAGISRRTHYHWYETDQDYREAADSINDLILDVSEEKLFGRIRECDMKAITFLLRYRGKSRGYSLAKDKEPDKQKLTIKYFVKDQQTLENLQKVKEEL
jgi:hypothetical protein